MLRNLIISAVACFAIGSPGSIALAQSERHTSDLMSTVQSLFSSDEQTIPDSLEVLDPQVVRIIAINLNSRTGQVTGDSAGSGFVLNGQGYIATNWHVVHNVNEARTTRASDGRTVLTAKPFDLIFAGRSGQHSVVEELVWANSDLDLAILKLEKPIGKPVTLTENEPERDGPVTAVGYPGNSDDLAHAERAENFEDVLTRLFQLESVISRGNLQTVHEDRTWFGELPDPVPLKIVAHGAIINKGNSGGPLFDGCGRVIGVNTQKPASFTQVIVGADGQTEVLVSANEGVYFASHASELIDVLRSQGISFQSGANACLPWTPGSRLDPSVIGLALASFLSLGIAVFALMRQPVRQAISSGVTGLVGRPGAVKGRGGRVRPGQEPKPRSAASAGASLILDAMDSSGRLVRLEVPKSEADRSADGFVVGRMPELCHAHVDDPMLSKRQARFFWKDGAVTIEDLNSTNLSLVNGEELKPFTPHKLRNGDVLLLGALEYAVTISIK